MDDKLLSIYLNDHLAGAAAGLELARRALSNNRGTSYESFLNDLVAAIERDRAELEGLMKILGIPQDPLKQKVAWVAEKAGRLKLNGALTGYSPLSRLIELEGLYLGVTGKRALWRSLQKVAAHDSRLAVANLEELISRAEEQRAGLEQHRLKAATDALV